MRSFVQAFAGLFAGAVVGLTGLGATSGAGAQELVKLPPPALVTDQTATLSAQQRTALEQKLQAFETAHGSQIAVVILPTTQPEDIASFGNRLGEAWKLGRKSVGDGIIVIVAKSDKKMRIEVARTLEGAVPDASAKRIIREQLAPAFSQGDFYGGIDRALDMLFRLVEGEGLPAPSAADARSTAGEGDVFAAIAPIFLVALFAGALLRGLFGKAGALLAGGGAAGAAWWFIGLPLLLAGGVGVFVALIVLAMGGGRRGGPIVIGGPHWGGGGWSSGGGGGGWSSGGGGDFSGGGASGSWD